MALNRIKKGDEVVVVAGKDVEGGEVEDLQRRVVEGAFRIKDEGVGGGRGPEEGHVLVAAALRLSHKPVPRLQDLHHHSFR